MPKVLLNVLILLALVSLGVPAQRAEETGPTPDPIDLDTIPPRPSGAISGSEFARRTSGMQGIERQRSAVDALLRGNVPSFLRRMVPVRLSRELAEGGTVEAWVWVSSDYLAIGSDQDFLHMPLTYYSATRVADAFGCVLPTTRIVDAVYQQSRYHLLPDPLPPGPKMRSSEYYVKHRQLVERQRRGIPLGTLLSGHKKDVVLTRRLATRAGRIAIYGWHRPSGDPIQPLSTIHEARYADYSHGIRLVWNTVLVDGEPRSIYEILVDPRLAPLLSDEGEICTAWKLMHPEGKKIRPKDLATCP